MFCIMLLSTWNSTMFSRAREIASAGTGMAPGTCQFVGGRPKAIPCLKLFSFLYPKSDLNGENLTNRTSLSYLTT